MQHMLPVKEIECLGRLTEIAEQLRHRNSRQASMPAFLEPITQAAVSQLHDDVEAVGLGPETLGCQEKRVTQALDQLQRLQLALSFLVVDGAEDDLDRHFDPAGCLGKP